MNYIDNISMIYIWINLINMDLSRPLLLLAAGTQ